MRLTQLYDQEYTKPRPQAGDVIEIELNESTVIETTVAGCTESGEIEVYLDDAAINLMQLDGMIVEDAPFLAKAAGGLALGALGAAGAPAIVGLLGPIFGTALAAYGAYNSAKGGMWAVDKLWDMATKKLGDSGAEQFAQDHIRAAAKHLAKFDFNGREYPVTLKPDQVKPAIQAVKAVAESLIEAKYHGKEVQLGKPVRGGPKKFYVYVRDPSTKNIKKVNFGDPNMRIKKSSPKHRKSFRARHHCENPGPRTKARYWSCRKW